MNYFKPAAAVATSIAMVTTPVMAGGMAEPVMEPEVIVEESSGSSGDFVLPLFLLVILAGIISSDSNPVPMMEVPME